MRVPINVTDKTPITIPNAVRIERVLLAKIDPNEIRKFSQNKPIMKQYFLIF
jgi:hypothetical protein